jgi:hypothetical protein
MNSQDLHNLQEAYMEVYGEGFKRLPVGRMMRQAIRKGKKLSGYENTSDKSQKVYPKHLQAKELRGQDVKYPTVGEYQEKMKRQIDKMITIGDTHDNEKAKAKSKLKKEQVDLYDIILSHLLDEGYADSYEAAEIIMVNMSEDWRESICEELTGERKKRALEKGGYLANRVASGKEGQPVERRNGSGDITMRTTTKAPTKRGGSGFKGRIKSDWYGTDDTQGSGNASARRQGKKVKDTSDEL